MRTKSLIAPKERRKRKIDEAVKAKAENIFDATSVNESPNSRLTNS